MAFLIRRWVRENKDTRRREYREIVVRSRQLSVGRASDQQLQISDPKVQLKHAIIEMRGRGRLFMRALTPSGFYVNRKPRKAAVLRQGDVIRIGSAAITVDQLRPGRPIVLGFGHVADPDPGEMKSLHMTSIGETGLSKSFWSWTLSLSIIAVFFLIPLSGLIYSSLRDPLRSTPVVPSDNVWISGPLHASHQAIGKDCNVCHAAPFRMVRNQECVTCHRSTQHHVDVASQDVALFAEDRCASCHHEHNEPSTLVQPDQRLCTDCHLKLDKLQKAPEVLNVGDFGRDHPDFRLSMLEARGQGAATLWERVKVPPNPEKPAMERSNLSFSHRQHLDPKGIKTPDGSQVMVCEDCHRPNQSGRLMTPITMEVQCSRCHSLQFDETDPATKVPHGDLPLLYKSLQEHFSRRFFEQTQPTTVASVSRRRPGESGIVRPEEQRRARDWIEQMTFKTARDLLENRVCVDCHQIERDPGGEPTAQWIIDPVRLTDQWMPMASFDHKSHITQPCVSCHKNAERSDRSTDILMPGITDCRECHAGVQEEQKLASDCLMCHKFHLPNRGIFEAPKRPATQRLIGTARLLPN